MLFQTRKLNSWEWPEDKIQLILYNKNISIVCQFKNLHAADFKNL